MKEIITENEVSRRSVLKGAAAGAAALTVGGVVASTLGASAASAATTYLSLIHISEPTRPY